MDILPAPGAVAALVDPARPVAAVLAVPDPVAVHAHLAVVPDPVAARALAVASEGHAPADLEAPAVREALCRLRHLRTDRTAASGSAVPDHPEEEAAASARSLLLSSFW